MIAAFMTAYFLHLVAAASPGPAILMAARVGLRDGMRTSVFLAAGIAVGALFWAVAAFFGLAVLFRAAPGLMWGFKLAGGLFLMWLALQMWRHADADVETPENIKTPTPLAAFWRGVATQLANPNPAVFFGAVFVGTIPTDASPLWVLALLGAILINEFACCTIVARLFSIEYIRRGYLRLKHIIDRGFGGILALLGLKVAFT